MMSKYHSTPTEVNGIRFDSKREANRWAELRLMERAGKIQKLKRQVKYLLIPSQYRDGKCIEREASYIADFVYIKDGRLVVEDCKGFRTPEYRLKRKLMLQLYDIRLVET
jgi:hypothetical protein